MRVVAFRTASQKTFILLYYLFIMPPSINFFLIDVDFGKIMSSSSLKLTTIEM